MRSHLIAPFVGALLLCAIAPLQQVHAQAVDITPPSPGARAFGDGRGAALAWNDHDPMLEPRPIGLAHFGVQLAMTISSGELGVPFGGELMPYLDLRFTRSLQLRIGAVLGAQLDQGAGDPNLQASSGLGVGFGGGRVLVGAVGPGLAFRVGIELGAEYLEHSLGEVSLYGGGLMEFAFRLLDDENLEVVVGMAIQDRSHSYRDLARPVVVIADGAVVRGYAGMGVMF